jgi:hypothetical protein
MILHTPKNMMDFFRKSEGTWLTQRTVHHFDLVADESGESNLMISVIEQNDPRILEICTQQGIDPSKAMGGASFLWQANLDDVPPNEDWAAILIEKIPVMSRYWFGQDGILTIDTEYDNNQGQERCWFLTDDFRVRVSTARMMNGVNLMAYCSERRCPSPESLDALIRKNLERAAIAQQ